MGITVPNPGAPPSELPYKSIRLAHIPLGSSLTFYQSGIRKRPALSLIGGPFEQNPRIIGLLGGRPSGTLDDVQCLCTLNGRDLRCRRPDRAVGVSKSTNIVSYTDTTLRIVTILRFQLIDIQAQTDSGSFVQWYGGQWPHPCPGASMVGEELHIRSKTHNPDLEF